jgi:large conductance mechanosensitive channel
MIKEFVTFLKQYGVIGLAIAVIIGGKLNLFIKILINCIKILLIKKKILLPE